MRVNVDSKAYADPRFKRLANALHITWFEALGRCLPVWCFAYEQRSEVMGYDDVDAIAELSGFSDQMVRAGLAEAWTSSEVRLCGVKERIGFLHVQDAKRELASAAKRAAVGLKAEGKPSGNQGQAKAGQDQHVTSTIQQTSSTQPASAEQVLVGQRRAPVTPPPGRPGGPPEQGAGGPPYSLSASPSPSRVQGPSQGLTRDLPSALGLAPGLARDRGPGEGAKLPPGWSPSGETLGIVQAMANAHDFDVSEALAHFSFHNRNRTSPDWDTTLLEELRAEDPSS
ncbi:MAG TPA: hypothetical protein VG963_09145 [Polyangiaceae bacterium]|nr:hypothetical protein [Polyangiaceae bacterium]